MPRATAPSPPRQQLVTYGYEFNEQHQVDIERTMWLEGLPILKPTGDGKLVSMGADPARHCRNIMRLLWPWNPTERTGIELNPWSLTLIDELATMDKFMTITGPGAGSKTGTVARFAMAWWYRAPHESAVVMTSTTLDGLERRVLGEAFNAWRERPFDGFGNLVVSEKALQFQKGNKKLGVFGFPVDQGNADKSKAKIIGFHPPRLMVIVDEMTDTPQAIVDACENLTKGTIEFHFIGIGNARIRADPHGKMSEPVNGWDSISVDSDKWETKFGKCIHLDGEKSPNRGMGENKKYPYMISDADIELAIKKFGGRNTPGYWRFTRGFWVPEGVGTTVLSDAILCANHAYDQNVVWNGVPKKYFALDPAFEGNDKCILREMLYGQADGGQASTVDGQQVIPMQREVGKMLVKLGQRHVITFNPRDKKPMHQQLAQKIVHIIREAGCGPEDFAMDTTGEGGGLASIICMEFGVPGWKIRQVEFGGSASETLVEWGGKVQPAKDVYMNRVAELWYQARRYVEQGQVRGMDADTAAEFCSREYETGKKISVEKKSDMKARIGKSPDDADAVVVGFEGLRIKGVFGRAGVRLRGGATPRSMIEQARRVDFDAQADYAA